jgi:D-3-phosphoglycerate dehydrogenase
MTAPRANSLPGSCPQYIYTKKRKERKRRCTHENCWIDDYQNAFKTLKCFPKLAGHDVVVFTDTANDVASLAEKLKDADAVVLTQQRSYFPRELIEKLPKLKLIGQTGRAATHVDLDACTEKGIVSAGGSGIPTPPRS